MNVTPLPYVCKHGCDRDAIMDKLTKAEAERDAALATLAAARAMLASTGAALADAIRAGEAQQDELFNLASRCQSLEKAMTLDTTLQMYSTISHRIEEILVATGEILSTKEITSTFESLLDNWDSAQSVEDRWCKEIKAELEFHLDPKIEFRVTAICG